MKINLVIADRDEMYLNRFAGYIQEKGGGITVYAFSSMPSFEKHLALGENTDIILFSASMLCDSVRNSPSVKLLMAEDDRVSDMGFDCVNKYQKAESFLSTVLLYYAEKSGHSEAVIKGNKNSIVAGFYSPIGGSGKTNLALAVTAGAGRRGRKSLYLSFERISSVGELLRHESQRDISDVFLALKSKEGNAGLKLMEAKYTDTVSSVTYVNPSRSALEINEVTNDELCRFIQEVDAMGEFDIICADFDSSLNIDKINILRCCDVIVVPFTEDYAGEAKLRCLLGELELQGEELEDIGKKLIFVKSKSTQQGCSFLADYISVPYCTALSSPENVLRSPEGAEMAVRELIDRIEQSDGGAI